ncbi:MAG: glycosyltransferase family 2 protein [Candidatus Bathyarchaeia archaeon]
MKVSIVIPTYYRPKDLADLFDSILRQTVKPMEVIVVDDTPTDVIARVCEVYHNEFKRFNIEFAYVRNYKKPSLTIARNIGVSMVKGEIILFLDSDIILYSDYIEKILEIFERNPNALGAQGWIIPKNVPLGSKELLKYFILNNLRKLFLLWHFTSNSCGPFSYPIILNKISNCRRLSGSNMAFRRVVFSEFRFDENLLKYSYLEDLLFTYPIQKKYPNTLYITPYAKCIHKVSVEGRIEASFLERPYLRICRKYALMKLFGVKGLLIFSLQTLGLLMHGILRKIWRFR